MLGVHLGRHESFIDWKLIGEGGSQQRTRLSARKGFISQCLGVSKLEERDSLAGERQVDIQILSSALVPDPRPEFARCLMGKTECGFLSSRQSPGELSEQV